MSYLTPDGRAGGAELRLGGRRHGGARCGHPRLRPPQREDARQLLGRPRTGRTLYILLPSRSSAPVLVSQGVVQTFDRATSSRARPLAGQRTQTIALGPVASQVAIKQLGTNGGGFYNVNSARPFENPTPLTNFLELLVDSADSGCALFTFGQMVGARAGLGDLRGDDRHLVDGSSSHCRPSSTATRRCRHGRRSSGPRRHGGNMEGKEARFGIADSALWATATTAASNGRSTRGTTR